MLFRCPSLEVTLLEPPPGRGVGGLSCSGSLGWPEASERARSGSEPAGVVPSQMLLLL